MVTIVDTTTIIKDANEVADSLSSKVDAMTIRAATFRLASLEAELAAHRCTIEGLRRQTTRLMIDDLKEQS